MTLEKVHQKLQTQAATLIVSLNNFTESTIQPCVEQCEALQKELFLLQETIAVYKHQKQDKEISPSFQIHSKVSAAVEKQIPVENTTKLEENTKSTVTELPITEPVKETSPDNNVVANQIQPNTVVNLAPEENKTVEPQANHHHQSFKPLSVALNDKFRFINELFLHNAAEYNIAIEQINTLQTWQECDLYLSSLKQLYNWSEQKDVVKHFFTVVKKRFE